MAVRSHRPRSRRPARRTRMLAAALCLTTSLAVSACSGNNSAATEESGPSTGSGLSVRTEQPSAPAPAPSPTPSAAGGLGMATASAPTVSPRGPWVPPDLKFYNEDFSVWYQDDSVINTDSVTDRGNIEGFRTYNGNCIGYETRDISPEVYALGFADEPMSSSLVEVKETTISEYAETSRTTLNLIRDDAGTMDGYSITWTGVFTASDGTSENVEGYHFARAVGDVGLQFSVLAMCRAGYNLTAEEWNTILAGIRIEGLSAGSMND